MPLSSRAKQVLNHAAEESILLEDGYIGTEHLLLGLLREDKSVSNNILHEIGLNVDLVRERMKHRDRGLSEEDGPKDYLKRLINEMRNLATEMLEKTDRIEEMLDRHSSEKKETDQNNRV